MDKAALRKFAFQARNKLKKGVQQKSLQLRHYG